MGKLESNFSWKNREMIRDDRIVRIAHDMFIDEKNYMILW